MPISHRMYMHHSIRLLCICFTFSSVSPLFCCTAIRIKTKDGGAVYARTMEFPFDFGSEIIAIPRGYSFSGTLPDGSKGITWKAKYAVIGANVFKQNQILDGINEMGLAFGALYFNNYAHYQTITPQDKKRALAPWEFGTWILTTCATIDEVKRALTSIKIGATKTATAGINIAALGADYIPPLHYIVHDATGKSIVIEPINGTLQEYDNPLGALTNSPTFDWHLTNLNNYVNLTPTNVPPLSLGEFAIKPTGQGSGMLGLPGDFTPPSRFIRAAALSLSALPADTAQEGVSVAINIINNISIAKGMIRDIQKTGTTYEYTQWVIVSDLTNCRLYYRTYQNHCYHAVDLKTINFESNVIKKLAMEEKAAYDNVTEKLK